MAFLEYYGVGISALSAAVPRTVINNYEYTQYFPKEQVKEVVDKVGIYERRFADENTCSSDLCFVAAEKLIADNNINREEIDLRVFCHKLLIIGCLRHLFYCKTDWGYLTRPLLLILL